MQQRFLNMYHQSTSASGNRQQSGQGSANQFVLEERVSRLQRNMGAVAHALDLPTSTGGFARPAAAGYPLNPPRSSPAIPTLSSQPPCSSGSQPSPPTSGSQPHTISGQLRFGLCSTPRCPPYVAPPYIRRRSYAPPPCVRLPSRTRKPQTPGRKFTRNIVVVDRTDNNIPRGQRRRQLHEMGYLVNLVDFWANWSEEQVVRTIEDALGGVIDPSKPEPR